MQVVVVQAGQQLTPAAGQLHLAVVPQRRAHLDDDAVVDPHIDAAPLPDRTVPDQQPRRLGHAVARRAGTDRARGGRTGTGSPVGTTTQLSPDRTAALGSETAGGRARYAATSRSAT